MRKEVERLRNMLDKAWIPYEYVSMKYGEQIVYDGGKRPDVASTDFTYGGGDGLLEAFGFPECQKDVIGWLDAEEAFALFESYHKRMFG